MSTITIQESPTLNEPSSDRSGSFLLRPHVTLDDGALEHGAVEGCDRLLHIFCGAVSGTASAALANAHVLAIASLLHVLLQLLVAFSARRVGWQATNPDGF